MSGPRIAFVTGANGFIGHHLVRHLGQAGWRVRGLVRTPMKAEERERFAGAELVEGDLADARALARGCQGAQAVVHCAAMVGVSDREAEMQAVNVDGTLNVLEAAAAERVPRVIHLSTAGVLGPVRVAAADEATPLHPSNAYARSKAEAERRAWALAARLDLPLAVVRPPLVYGRGDRRTLGLFEAVQRGWPMPWRTDVPIHPVHVDDFCRGLLACLDAFPRPIGRTYHLAGPAPVPMREFVGLIARAVGARPPPHLPLGLFWGAATVADRVAAALRVDLPLTRRRLHVFAYANAFSIEQAVVDFGYAPREALDQGLVQAAEWYREHGLLPR